MFRSFISLLVIAIVFIAKSTNGAFHVSRFTTGFYGLNYYPQSIYPDCGTCRSNLFKNLCYHKGSSYDCSARPCIRGCESGFCALTSFGYHQCAPRYPCGTPCSGRQYCALFHGSYSCQDFHIVQSLYQNIRYSYGNRFQYLCYYPSPSNYYSNYFYPAQYYNYNKPIHYPQRQGCAYGNCIYRFGHGFYRHPFYYQTTGIQNQFGFGTAGTEAGGAANTGAGAGAETGGTTGV